MSYKEFAEKIFEEMKKIYPERKVTCSLKECGLDGEVWVLTIPDKSEIHFNQMLDLLYDEYCDLLDEGDSNEAFESCLEAVKKAAETHFSAIENDNVFPGLGISVKDIQQAKKMSSIMGWKL